jgi:hypothetical protein
VVALLDEPVRDRDRLLGHLEALAEGPGETLQQGPRQGTESAVKVLDRRGIEDQLARVGRG